MFFTQVLLLMASALNGNIPGSSPTRAGDSLTTELRTRQQSIAEITEMIHVSLLELSVASTLCFCFILIAFTPLISELVW